MVKSDSSGRLVRAPRRVPSGRALEPSHLLNSRPGGQACGGVSGICLAFRYLVNMLALDIGCSEIPATNSVIVHDGHKY
jgi:hypothetical protein